VGRPKPDGSLSLNSLPSAPFKVSVVKAWSQYVFHMRFVKVNKPVKGLKFKVPAMVMATTRSGEVTKEWVAGLASLRPVKLRL
jgi:hypothetical protein